MLKPKIALSLLALLFIACQNSAQEAGDQSADSTTTSDTGAPTKSGLTQNNVSADWLLIPGKSAGQTKLQETSMSVIERLGPPDGGDAATMHAVSVWYADGEAKTGHALSIFTVRDAGNDPTARVTQIRVDSPRFQTDKGLGVGTPLTEIEQQFQVQKVNEYKDKGPAYTLYDDRAAGIAFEIGASDGKCRAVIVHEAGKPFAGSYLTFP